MTRYTSVPGHQILHGKIVLVKGPPHHIRVIWGVEKIPVSFTKATNIDRHIVNFSQDLVEDILLPTIKIPQECWMLHDRLIVSVAT